MIEKIAEWLNDEFNVMLWKYLDDDEKEGWFSYAKELLSLLGINPELLGEDTRIAVVRKEGKLPDTSLHYPSPIYKAAQQDMLKAHWVKEVKEEFYPCDKCGKLRTKAQGGTVFSLCDDCWDKHYKKEATDATE